MSLEKELCDLLAKYGIRVRFFQHGFDEIHNCEFIKIFIESKHEEK